MRRKQQRSPGPSKPAPSGSGPASYQRPDPSLGIVEWRRQRLLRAGFGTEQSAAVAAEGAYDLHSLIELAERGCPPALAIRILAPLDPNRPAC
jgi:hypothetical protein